MRWGPQTSVQCVTVNITVYTLYLKKCWEDLTKCITVNIKFFLTIFYGCWKWLWPNTRI